MNLLGRLLLVRRLNNHFYRWDRDDLRRHQELRTGCILGYARTSSPYYQSRLPGRKELTLCDAPPMDKTEMMEHFDEINTRGLRKDDLIAFKIRQEREGLLDLYQGEYSVGLSSGTSGNKGLAVISRKERQMYSCLLWARSGVPRKLRRNRVLFALRTNNPAFMEVRSLGVEMIYVDYTHPPVEVARLINEKKLNILAGPPSLLGLIADQREVIEHRIDALVSYAEVLTDENKARLEQIFQAPVVQIYQASEGFIGSTCRAGRLHLNEDIILVELEDAGDAISGAKNVVITDLYRTTQPVIRYSLNDVLEVSSGPCECGSCFRVIERIHGRVDDIFHLKGRDGKMRLLFPDYVRRSINQASDSILEYQAIQHSVDTIEIRLLLKEGADRPEIEKAVRENIGRWADRVGGRPGIIEFTDRQPERNPRSRKLIRVVRTF